MLQLINPWLGNPVTLLSGIRLCGNEEINSCRESLVNTRSMVLSHEDDVVTDLPPGVKIRFLNDADLQ
jgi:hypothetical protein